MSPELDVTMQCFILFFLWTLYLIMFQAQQFDETLLL